MKIFIKNILLICILPSALLGQFSRDSLSFITENYTIKRLSSGFTKQLNTYNLGSNLNYGARTGDFFTGLQEDFRSTLIKTATKNIRDEQHFSLIGEYEFIPSLKAGILTNSNIYSDDRKIDINKASTFNSSLFIKAMPADNIKIIPFGGLSLNQQVGEDDQGYLYGSEGLADFFNLDNFTVLSSFKFLNEDISPRKNTLRYFNFNLNNNFESNLSNTISAAYSQLRKDFYFKADDSISAQYNINNNIQSRIESGYFVQDRFFYLSENQQLVL